MKRTIPGRAAVLALVLIGLLTPALALGADDGGAPVGVRKVMLAYDDNNVIRSGPGNQFAIVAILKKGPTFEVIAKKGDWNNIRLSGTETGWIHTSLCYEFDDLSDLEFRPNPRLFSRIGSYVLTGYAGGYSFDRKSNSVMAGGRLGYYLFDFLEVEGGVAWTHINRPAEIVESLFDLTLEAEEFHMLFYEMNLNLKLLPGRRLVPFVSAGIGSSIFRGRTEPSTNYGAGTMFFLSKHTAFRWDLRNYRFDSGFDAARRTNNNYVFTVGTALIF